jgi:3-dehydroquinate dehydratase/shikimate dehydrogenase
VLVLCLDEPLEKTKYPFDLYELRFDLFPFKTVPSDKSWILTLRRKKEGGALDIEESKRWELIDKLLAFRPDYLDLEHDVPLSFAKKIKKLYPKIKLIRSFHNLTETPDFLDVLLKDMQHPLFSAYKFACFANSYLDSLRMLSFVKNAKLPNLSGMCLGPKGDITRVLGPVVGNYMNYTSLKGFMGQVPLNILHDTYNFQNLEKQTKIFGLIGSPISQSIGHIFHNQFFQKHKVNAVYVKMELVPEELDAFFQIEKGFPFYGISVTTPLKQKMAPYIENKQKIVNTLIKNSYWRGENTDGIGAIKAILAINPLIKKALLLGAGATARAIYEEGKKRNIHFAIYNRTLSRVQEFFPKNITVFQDLKNIDFSCYDLIIQATSAEMLGSKLNIDFSTLKKGTVVMDVVRNKGLTQFLQRAKEKGARCIDGNDLFYWQGYFQQNLWQKKNFPEDTVVEFRKKSY